MIRLVALLVLLFSVTPSLGISIITGKVLDDRGNALSFCNIMLVNASDSVLIKATTSDDRGVFRVETSAEGNVLLWLSYTGFADHFVSLKLGLDQQHELGQIKLLMHSSNLGGVVITGRRPLIEQKIDRTIVNVKNSITSAGNTVLEVLEKSPGVQVNRANAAIAMNGKEQVNIMINGRMQYMPVDAVVQLLAGIPASNVDKIELITTPPARYDAGGKGGYINIILVQNSEEGFSGNFGASYAVGNGTLPTANVTFNFRKNRVNLFGNYSFTRDAQDQTFEFYRSFKVNAIVKETETFSDRLPARPVHNVRAGVDISLDKKTILGILFSGYDNKWMMDAENIASYSSNGILDTSVIIVNDEINHWKHAMGNFNVQHHIKDGTEYSFNIDVLHYINRNPTNYTNNYYDGNGGALFSEATKSNKHTIINFQAAQFDYNTRLNASNVFSWGIKGVRSRFTNDILVARKEIDHWMEDPTFTANYFLKEEIGAAYVSMDKQIAHKTEMKFGLRYEYTRSNLGSEAKKDIIDRKYGNLFPSIFMQHKWSENKSTSLSYARRITRPSFDVLAPFVIFFDPKTFFSGNPAVQPAYTDQVKIDHTWKKVTFSLSYSYEKDAIAMFVPTIDTSTNSQTSTAQNLDHSQLYYASVNIPLRVTRWWNSQINVACNYSSASGIVQKEPLEVRQFYITLNGTETFTLPEGFSLEVSGNYQGKSFLFGLLQVQPFGALNIAAQKKFHEGQMALTIGVDNLLNTNKFRTTVPLENLGIVSNANLQLVQRMYKIAWTQSFGNRKLRSSRDRGTASDDVRSRVSN